MYYPIKTLLSHKIGKLKALPPKQSRNRTLIIHPIDIIIPHLPSFVNPFPTNSYFFQHKTSPFSPFSKGAFRIFTILILCRRQNPHSVSRVESFQDFHLDIGCNMQVNLGGL